MSKKGGKAKAGRLGASSTAIQATAPVFSPSTALKEGPPPERPAVLLDEPSPGAFEKLKTQSALQRFLAPAASLRWTVLLLALSLALVFYGTWAQAEASNWAVVKQYFRSFFVLIPLKIVILRAADIPGAIPFPGGWLLGSLLMVNLLAAHASRFRLSWRRAGILFIHGGLVVMMLGEVVTGVFQIESRMTIPESQKSNYVENQRETELAFVRQVDAKTDEEVVIPGSRLVKGRPIQDDQLPFDVQVERYFVNADVVKPQEAPRVQNVATAGVGLTRIALDKPETVGTDTQQRIELPAAYITLKNKETGASLGTFLVSTFLAFMQRPPDQVIVDGKSYALALRFQRSYRPYTFHLLKFEHKKYLGTETPKDYSSFVRVTDPENQEDREVRIYMNHPLYYRGETFYQAELHPLTKGTVLQVVENPGWWMPYIACGLVSLGMFAHFGLMLVGFLRRRYAL